ncbi:EscU/YscU/HrcU family type III secretion system export apparatus switch protein [Terrarubrum flagellatum]|uniref:EscU/YscU/HrcU family type III secretion system export apparatus switch protein n=1 Tax=Terrirubrum flagellatum TaxID=2895980 RepID=UPI003144F352
MSGAAERVAVAIAYDRETDHAPRVIAKGRGELAERIIATAREHGVAIEANPALAAALSFVELDDHIPEELYRAVAAVISFVLKMQQKSSSAR